MPTNPLDIEGTQRPKGQWRNILPNPNPAPPDEPKPLDDAALEQALAQAARLMLDPRYEPSRAHRLGLRLVTLAIVAVILALAIGTVAANPLHKIGVPVPQPEPTPAPLCST
jgi:hypothetical protein